jgi:hypothetical protein
MHTAPALPFFIPWLAALPCSNAGVFNHLGKRIMRFDSGVSTRQVLNDFAIACLLALGVGALVGLAAAAAVTLVTYLNT